MINEEADSNQNQEEPKSEWDRFEIDHMKKALGGQPQSKNSPQQCSCGSEQGIPDISEKKVEYKPLRPEGYPERSEYFSEDDLLNLRIAINRNKPKGIKNWMNWFLEQV